MNLRQTYFILLIVVGCKPAINSSDPVPADTIAADIEKPADADTTIATVNIAEFLEKKYTLDPVQQQELQSRFDTEEHDSVKISSVQLNGLHIEYSYTWSRAADSGTTEIKVNGVKRSFVDEDGNAAQDYGDLNLNLGLTLYTIAGEKYLLISCSPEDAVGWLSKIAYGMLIKIENSHTVMQTGTSYYPGDPYLTGDFYIRQDRFSGKVFYLKVTPASFDDNGNPDKIYLKKKELHL